MIVTATGLNSFNIIIDFPKTFVTSRHKHSISKICDYVLEDNTTIYVATYIVRTHSKFAMFEATNHSVKIRLQ